MSLTIREFQFITSLNTSAITYEEDLVTYLGIDTSNKIDKVKEELKKRVEIKPISIKNNKVRFKGRTWVLEDIFLERTFEQWKRLETIIAEGDNVKNLHKILAIYFRPKSLLGGIKRFDLKTQEKIENELLDLDMSVAQTLINTFFLFVIQYMKYINIYFLNQMKEMIEV